MDGEEGRHESMLNEDEDLEIEASVDAKAMAEDKKFLAATSKQSEIYAICTSYKQHILRIRTLKFIG